MGLAVDPTATHLPPAACRQRSLPHLLPPSPPFPPPLSVALQNVQSFLSNMMGASWQDFVPDSWALPSFDWSKMGEFGEWGWVAVVD